MVSALITDVTHTEAFTTWTNNKTNTISSPPNLQEKEGFPSGLPPLQLLPPPLAPATWIVLLSLVFLRVTPHSGKQPHCPTLASLEPHTEWPHGDFPACRFSLSPEMHLLILPGHMRLWVHIIYCMTTPRGLHSELMKMCIFSGFRLLQNAAVLLSYSSPGDWVGQSL